MPKKKNNVNSAVSAEALSAGEESLPDIKAPSLEELKDVARRIITGEASELDFSVKGEIGELLRLLMDVKTRVDDIAPTVLSSQQDIPIVLSSLTNVSQTTEKAAFNLLENAKAMSNFYQSLQNNVEAMQKAVQDKNNSEFETNKNETSTHIEHAGELGLHILEALEFQDITQQKITKVIRSVEEIGARLGAMVGFMKSSLDNSQEKKDYDNLLSDFGFA